MRRFLFIMFFGLVFTHSLAQINSSKNIQETWKVVEFKSDFPNINPSLSEDMKSIALSRKYTFDENNTFQMSSNEVVHAGGYLIDLEKQTIRLTYILSVEIVSFESDTMIWKQNLQRKRTMSYALKKISL